MRDVPGGQGVNGRRAGSFRGSNRSTVVEPKRLACTYGRADRSEAQSMYRSLLTVLALASIASEARAESGLASYYGGRGLRGEMTCAHRTRPLGSMVTVVYAGHSIRCRVNDRGPFIRGRVIDVSTSAARALGMMRSGVVRVSVE